MLNGKVILITGGTGSFGQQFCRTVLRRYRPKKLIVFSRDELKQYEMRQKFPDDTEERRSPMRYLVGDVRDQQRLLHAFREVEIVIHAAALKQVPSCEYNPMEAIKTNVIGAMNVVTAAINAGVKKVIALSTDKACNPINLYGATKLCSDKIFTAAKSYAGSQDIKFAVVRYGNVIGSRGSVIPVFLRQRKSGVLTITDERMTRFWITLQQGVDFVLDCLERMQGNEVFVPKIPSMRLVDLAKAIAPECTFRIIGIRPGEKLHEIMIDENDSRITREYDKYFVIGWSGYRGNHDAGQPCPPGFSYRSDTNTDWLTVEQLQEYVREFIEEHPEYQDEYDPIQPAVAR
ncbi:MAG: UDP-N-acetylglucosamine 4,6-dehydratase (inverting) [bacterium]|nr:UDP-N-acetylglucosamine 4,6-dehydratase (inverting) [bacterium]